MELVYAAIVTVAHLLTRTQRYHKRSKDFLHKTYSGATLSATCILTYPPISPVDTESTAWTGRVYDTQSCLMENQTRQRRDVYLFTESMCARVSCPRAQYVVRSDRRTLSTSHGLIHDLNDIKLHATTRR